MSASICLIVSWLERSCWERASLDRIVAGAETAAGAAAGEAGSKQRGVLSSCTILAFATTTSAFTRINSVFSSSTLPPTSLSFTVAQFLMSFARWQNFMVPIVSVKLEVSGDIVPMIAVNEFPPKLGCSRCVSLELLYPTCLPSLELLSLLHAKALITCPRISRDLLMPPASFRRCPADDVWDWRSEPARSTSARREWIRRDRFLLLLAATGLVASSSEALDCAVVAVTVTSRMNTAWLLLLLLFMFVDDVALFVIP